MDKPDVTIGKEIKKKREELGLTQAQVAKAVDISERHLQRIESGKYSPSLGTLGALASTLGVAAGIVFAAAVVPIVPAVTVIGAAVGYMAEGSSRKKKKQEEIEDAKKE